MMRRLCDNEMISRQLRRDQDCDKGGGGLHFGDFSDFSDGVLCFVLPEIPTSRALRRANVSHVASLTVYVAASRFIK